MLELVRDLCRAVTGSQCNPPRWSDWSLVSPSQTSLSVDVADVATLGAGAVVPVNLKAYGSYFLTGLQSDGQQMSTAVRGFGAGAGAGLGWGIPFVGQRFSGRMPNSIKRAVIERIGGSLQGRAVNMLLDATNLGQSGGTRLVTGPDAPAGNMSPVHFDGFATVVSLGASFVVNGVSAGLVFFSRNRPVIQRQDILHATGIGLIGAVGLALSLDLEASGIVYRVAAGG